MRHNLPRLIDPRQQYAPRVDEDHFSLSLSISSVYMNGGKLLLERKAQLTVSYLHLDIAALECIIRDVKWCHGAVSRET